MLKLSNIKIKNKINLMITTIALAVLTVALVYIINVNNRTLTHELRHNVETISKITADHLVAELMFNNQAEAYETIEKLDNLSGFLSSVVFTKEGEIFTSAGENLIETTNIKEYMLTNYSEFKEGMLYAYRIIQMEDNLLGTLVVIFSTRELQKKNHEFITHMVLFGLFLMVLSYFLASRFQKVISGPILRLMYTIEKVSEKLDFSLRAKKTSEDELGKLVDGFNFMMEQISQKDEKMADLLKQVQDKQEFIENVIDSMPSAMTSIGKDYIVTHWNDAAEKYSGFDYKNAVGKHLNESMPDVYNAIKDFQWKDNVTQSRTLGFDRKVPDVHQFFNLTVFSLANQNSLVLRIDDITEMKMKEDQLRQAQKMETIGTLSGGLAHDFNNVLMGISGAISIVKHRTETGQTLNGEELSKYFDTISNSAERASDIVKQLLTLSKKQDAVFESTDLNAVLAHILSICENSFDKCVKLNFYLTDTPAYVEGDRVQLEQVILNLCVNAYHAMTIMHAETHNIGGDLNVTLNYSEKGTVQNKSHPVDPDQAFWQISVADSGIGMDKTVIDKIFDPFYTTKDSVGGSGLGLAMVYNIIEQHNGFINVISNPDEGTIFQIFLPVHENTDAVSKKKNLKPASLVKGEGLVLIIDDEPVVRDLAEDVLTEFGFTVETAVNGAEGVEKYKKIKDRVVFVLLDMVMPIMNGKETFIQLKEINPDIKVIMASGFIKDKRVEDCIELGVCKFIQKPYSIHTLSKTVASAIYGN